MIQLGSPQFLYMCEAEGCDKLVNTRTAKINAVIRDIQNYRADVIPQNVFYEILRKHQLTDLNDYELAYIQEKIK